MQRSRYGGTSKAMSPKSKHAGADAGAPSLTLNRSHKLEGDGLITPFYDFLLLRNNETMKPCVNVFIPDTIVYYHNFPRGWFFTDTEKSREVMKRQGTDLDSSNVKKFFEVEPTTREKNPKKIGIVAYYLSINDEDDDTVTTSVEFFNKHTIHEFVERKNKKEGILQRFIIPKGGTRNTIIQAIWSPNPNAFFVWRRTNRMALDNKPQWERDPYPMCVTYDGPSHYSEEGTCAGKVKDQIRDVCVTIRNHFYHVYEKEKEITRLVLYFKLDENDQLWLLWCGGLRVADANSTTTDPTHHSVPLNLAPKYVDSSIEARQESKELELLAENNKKYYHLRKTASIDKNNSPNKSASGRSGGGGSPNNTIRGDGGTTSPTSQQGQQQQDYASNNNTTPNFAAAQATSHRVDEQERNEFEDDDPVAREKKAAEEKDAWYHQLFKNNEKLSKEYDKLVEDRAKVINYLEDVFYRAYGHFLQYDPGPFPLLVDKAIARDLGNDQLAEAMLAGGVQKATPSEGANNMEIDEDLYFEIPPKHPNGPVSKIGEAVKKWVENYYDKAILDLKEEAASTLPPLTTGAMARVGAASSSSTTAQATSSSSTAAANTTTTSQPASSPSGSPTNVKKEAVGEEEEL